MVEDKEKARAEGNDGPEACGDSWRALVLLIQHVWDTGEIPQQMQWMVVVLILEREFKGLPRHWLAGPHLEVHREDLRRSIVKAGVRPCIEQKTAPLCKIILPKST